MLTLHIHCYECLTFWQNVLSETISWFSGRQATVVCIADDTKGG